MTAACRKPRWKGRASCALSIFTAMMGPAAWAGNPVNGSVVARARAAAPGAFGPTAWEQAATSPRASTPASNLVGIGSRYAGSRLPQLN